MTMSRKTETNRGCVLAVVLGLTSIQALAAPPKQKDELFAGTERFAAGSKDTTEVNLDKNMMGLAAGMSGLSAGMMKKMDFVAVRTYAYAKPGGYKMADVDAFRKRLQGNGWSHLVKERSDSESTDVCVKTDHEGQMIELVVIDAEPLELDFVHLKGHMSMSDMMEVGKQYGAPGGSPEGGSQGNPAPPVSGSAATTPKLKAR